MYISAPLFGILLRLSELRTLTVRDRPAPEGFLQACSHGAQ